MCVGHECVPGSPSRRLARAWSRTWVLAGFWGSPRDPSEQSWRPVVQRDGWGAEGFGSLCRQCWLWMALTCHQGLCSHSGNHTVCGLCVCFSLSVVFSDHPRGSECRDFTPLWLSGALPCEVGLLVTDGHLDLQLCRVDVRGEEFVQTCVVTSLV